MQRSGPRRNNDMWQYFKWRLCLRYLPVPCINVVEKCHVFDLIPSFASFKWCQKRIVVFREYCFYRLTNSKAIDLPVHSSKYSLDFLLVFLALHKSRRIQWTLDKVVASLYWLLNGRILNRYQNFALPSLPSRPSYCNEWNIFKIFSFANKIYYFGTMCQDFRWFSVNHEYYSHWFDAQPILYPF